MSIKKWSEDDRPREKFHLKGKLSCSNSEILAILIGMGNAEKSALDLAKEIMSSVDHSFETLSQKSIPELMKYKGIGLAKAVTIAAALELGNRKQSEHTVEHSKIQSSRDGFMLLKHYYLGLKQETFYVIYLSNSLKPLKIEQISIGSTTSTLVDVKIIAKKALELLSSSVILSHNHPSGQLIPSPQDKELTQKISAALKLFDIQVLDHLILYENDFYSFKDEGLL